MRTNKKGDSGHPCLMPELCVFTLDWMFVFHLKGQVAIKTCNNVSEFDGKFQSFQGLHHAWMGHSVQDQNHILLTSFANVLKSSSDK